jgi:hypothetical protein
MKKIMNIIYLAFALFAFACFAISPTARAVDPPPDGGYPGRNTAEGEDALFSLQTMFRPAGNTAVGFHSLYSTTAGYLNTAIGDGALHSNITGHTNTATDAAALDGNTTGEKNSATGASALTVNTTGNANTATGFGALSFNTTGSFNIALGSNAGLSLTTGDHNIDIGNQGVAAEANTIRIGGVGTQTATFIAGISGATVPTGVPVVVDRDGHLGTITSSARFKEQIKPMDKASEVILSLKPVSFRYKHELDPEGTLQFGLVAEEVEKVDPHLVARAHDGKPYTVRYEAVNAMLLNEFLKEHRKNEKQEATIERLEKQIEVLTEGLQKVSAQLQLSTSAPKTALSN